MRAARLIVLGVAVAAGGVAAFLVSGETKVSSPPPPPAASIETVEVLVARKDISIGVALSPQDLQWQSWPAASAGPHLIRRSERPAAIEELAGALTRAALMSGEPVRESKLIKGKASGYMAAILPAGMRAVSTEISPETGAGGFILPNDRVDVILTRRDREAEKMTGIEAHVSETILTDVRVLAIDQVVEEKNGQRVAVGRTVTLEVSPRQAELLAMARQMGAISLALRSIADASRRDAPPDDQDTRASGRINLVRFGVTTSTLAK